MSETPLFDELEAKWNAVGEDSRICDEYTRCFYIETGAEWYEDDEGNEVFPEPKYAEGGIVTKVDPKLPVKVVNGYIELDDCPVALVPRHKRKLFGRNQGTNGTL